MPPDLTQYSIGVEEEYQIIDPITRDLSSSAIPLLHETRQILNEAVQHEILLSQIEVSTPVCQTLSQVSAHLFHLRTGLIAAAKNMGKQIAAAGTHPFAQWQNQQFSPGERYDMIQQTYRQLAYEQMIFGCHIHIGIVDRHEALQVMNFARGWLAVLLALTGNSPFSQHGDTGYGSYRSQIWARWPIVGPAHYFSSLTEYDELITALTQPGLIKNAREAYWDIRLSPRFPTVEVRIADVCMTIDETVMLAGLVRALVQTCHEQVIRNDSFISLRPEMLRAMNWQAARYGLDAYLLDPQSRRVLPATQLLEQLLTFIRPALQAQGDLELISQLVEILLRKGTGATRQREVYRQTNHFHDVVDFIVQETASGCMR